MNEDFLKIAAALLAGGLIGLEREYKSKAAGLRTITLICTGSALFTILSHHFGLNSPDRVASNIVTGIGFFGAGVIFKSDQTVAGLTTAATIWMAAAIGMAIGCGYYELAGISLAAALFVLLLMRTLQGRINLIHQIRSYRFTFHLDKMTDKELEQVFKRFSLSYRKTKEYRTATEATSVYEVSGRVTHLDQMNDHLMAMNLIDSFAY